VSESEALLERAKRASIRGDALEALTASDELLRREPDNSIAMFIAGTALLNSSHQGLAAIVLNASRCAADKNDAHQQSMIWLNIGCALQEYQPEEAYRAFRKSVEFEATSEAYDNLANVSSAIGRHAEALEWSNLVEGINPAHNRSFALMHLGRWGEAWAEYAKGVATSARPRTDRNYGLPRWDGKKKGKLVIHGEQGVGDEIMFMSMCPKDFDGVIDCSPRMEGLFSRSFPNANVYGTLLENEIEWPLKERCDYHIEMGGLGEHYGATPFSGGAFLTPDPARVDALKAWCDAMVPHLRALPRKKRIGIAWTGGAWQTGRARRSVPFELVAQHILSQHDDVTFVNLEYEDRKAELANWPDVLNPYWATKKGADMDDLAALCASLDLVITATNSTVDLCGALGVPVWAMTDENPQWRYSEQAGEDAMWFYQSARLFRQKPDDRRSWERVVKNVAAALYGWKLAGVKANGHAAHVFFPPPEQGHWDS
jgi:hypothetical protein